MKWLLARIQVAMVFAFSATLSIDSNISSEEEEVDINITSGR